MLAQMGSAPAIVAGITTAIIAALVALVRIRVAKKIEQAYLDGVQDGVKLETRWAVERALEGERLARERKLHDSGRRAEARTGAVPARIHKARIAPPPRKRPD
jgi:hypothetical protein